MTYTKRILVRGHYKIRTYRNDGKRAKVKDKKYSRKKNITKKIKIRRYEVPKHNRRTQYIHEILTRNGKGTQIHLNYHTTTQRNKILKQLQNIDLRNYGTTPMEIKKYRRAKRIKKIINDMYETDGPKVKSYSQATLREMAEGNKRITPEQQRQKPVNMKKLIGGFKHVL